ncbi:MAG: TerB family tellurite resistance protein [Rhodococcus sp.]|nr:TerB family tellurite resistance protein [Rhodococcus sp. (in: high G+C Gram-positive bacteria)]
MIRDDADRLRRWHDRLAELGVDSPLSHPICFKKELHIGARAYRSLTVKKRVLSVVRPLGAAGVGASVASSSVVATAFFPAGILGALGLATAATPIGWVIGTAVFSGAAWTLVSKKLDDLSSNRVVEIPKFINTPLDLLAVSIIDLICSLAVKLAAIDGEYHERERVRIARYFVEDWGYDERFVKLAIDMVNESDLGFNDLVKNLVDFTRSNPDCHAPAIRQNVLAFLHEVAEASDGIRESERHALLEAEKAFTPEKSRFTAVAKRRLRFRGSARG